MVYAWNRLFCGLFPQKPLSAVPIHASKHIDLARSLGIRSGDGSLRRSARVTSVSRTVLTSCLPYLIIICLSSYVVGFVAILVMDTCWTRVIELDYGALGMNVVTFIGIFKKARTERPEEVGGLCRCMTRWP